MPTARELLEQADALMRRNRQEAERRVAVPAPPAPGAPTVATEQGIRGVSPAIAPVASPPPATAPAPAVARAGEIVREAIEAAPAGAHAPAPADDEDIPVLDEVVEAEPEAGALPAGGASGPEVEAEAGPDTDVETESDADVEAEALAEVEAEAEPEAEAEGAPEDEDVPVLTDAIDEIEVAAPPADEGEPSDWLVEPPEDESILGPSPPSIAVVPPAVAGLPEIGPDAPQIRDEPVTDIEDVVRPLASRDAEEAARREAAPELGAPNERLADIEALAESALADLDPDVTWTRPIVAPPPAAPTVEAAEVPEPVELASPGVDEAGSAASFAAEAAVASRPAPTGAEWDALAEEIRMQVLQRIDIFTDTGLRERLGERLKPIVDRASADLVATINQHVGELLRAYVAEAIEREIDRWRQSR